MTVEELIDDLMELDPEAQVYITDGDNFKEVVDAVYEMDGEVFITDI